MKFQSLTEEEIQRALFIDDGEYNYQVIKADEKIAKKTGNDYIALELIIWDKAGKERKVFCNLWSIKLLKHFCDVNNMQDDYKLGEVPAYKCAHKSGGKVIIGFTPERANPDGGIYKAKNEVLDFIRESVVSNVLDKPKQTEEFKDDDLPF